MHMRCARYVWLAIVLRHGFTRTIFVTVSDELRKTPSQRGYAGCGGWQAGNFHDSYYAGELRQATCHNVGL